MFCPFCWPYCKVFYVNSSKIALVKHSFKPCKLRDNYDLTCLAAAHCNDSRVLYRWLFSIYVRFRGLWGPSSLPFLATLPSPSFLLRIQENGFGKTFFKKWFLKIHSNFLEQYTFFSGKDGSTRQPPLPQQTIPTPTLPTLFNFTRFELFSSSFHSFLTRANKVCIWKPVTRID